jgi:hypothetical protein
MSDSVTDVIKYVSSLCDHLPTLTLHSALQEQLNQINKQQERGTFKRHAQATVDADDLMNRYRQIQSLFRRL